MLLDFNMDKGTIFHYSIQRCIGNTIYKKVTFSRIILLCTAIKTITEYKIVS